MRALTLRRWFVAAALALLSTFAGACRADTVASLLGNFTINQFVGLRVAERSAEVRYTVVFGQLPALRELHRADTDGDGVTTQAERDAYARTLAPGFADGLDLRVDGAAVPLKTVRWTTSLPTEQGGFSLRLDVDFSGALPAGTAQHRVTLTNANFAGRFGWQEIVVERANGVAIYDSDAFGTSLTAGLTEAVQSLPANGPLAERSVHFAYRAGSMPAGSIALAPRPGTVSTAPGASPAGDTSSWLASRTRTLVDLISTPTVPLHVALFALLAALVLGALHAFSPGHGKTVVGAYLVGSRGTPRHALFLGVTVTVTHTLGVFALGFATLLASRWFVPERLFPVLSLASGLLVLALGIVLLRQRWRGAHGALAGAGRPVYRTLALAPGLLPGLYHRHDRHGALVHSHGGRMHSHLPPGASGEPVTWRSLLALGISGGLVPCPSAMVLLLAAIALNKTAYGLLLVLAFSVGLAATLTGVGLAFLYARDRMMRTRRDTPWLRLVPVASAGMVTLIGALMCYGAIATGS